jgi:hypothetical protein
MTVGQLIAELQQFQSDQLVLAKPYDQLSSEVVELMEHPDDPQLVVLMMEKGAYFLKK